jgi:hypothetical protein
MDAIQCSMLTVSRQWMWLLRVLVKINKDYRETRQVSSFTSLGRVGSARPKA